MWLFNLALQLPALSCAKDVCLVFLAIMEDAQDNRSIPIIQILLFQMMCQNIVEVHTILDICTPCARLASLLPMDGYLTIK